MGDGKKTVWLHLSDFHFYNDQVGNVYIDEFKKFFDDPDAPKIDFILVTGDLHDSHDDVDVTTFDLNYGGKVNEGEDKIPVIDDTYNEPALYYIDLLKKISYFDDDKKGKDKKTNQTVYTKRYLLESVSVPPVDDAGEPTTYINKNDKDDITITYRTGHRSTRNSSYEKTLEFLNTLSNELKVDKKNFFIIPGNHDAKYPKNHDDEYIVPKYDPINSDEYAGFLDECMEAEVFSNYWENLIKGFYGSDQTFYKNPENTCVREVHDESGRPIISVVHFNTALVKGDRAKFTDGILDRKGTMKTDTHRLSTDDFEINEDIPAIAIGHNRYDDLNSKQMKTINEFFRKYNVAAYLCGDGHQKQVVDIDLSRYTEASPIKIPSICCPKSVADNTDNYSHFGFIIYTWDHDSNTVEVVPYRWSRDVSCILPSYDFRTKDSKKEYEFSMKKRLFKQNLQKIQYINDKNSKSNTKKSVVEDNDIYILNTIEGKSKKEIDNATILSNILDVIEDNKDGKRLLVLGDVMLDHYMYCKGTGISQSQTHDTTNDYSLFKKKEMINEFDYEPDEKFMGGAANVACACSEIADTVLFGIIGDDGEGKDLLTISKDALSEDNVYFCCVPETLTITKIYTEVSKLDDQGKVDDSAKRIIRVNREVVEEDNKFILKKALNKGIKESDIPSGTYTPSDWLDRFKDELTRADGIILKDHEKGLFSEKEYSDGKVSEDESKFLEIIINAINDRIQGKDKYGEFIVALDPKYHWDKFKTLNKIDLILPNVKELTATLYPNDPAIWKDREENHCLSDGDWGKVSSKKQWWNKENRVDCIALTEDKNGASIYIPSPKSRGKGVVKSIYSVDAMRLFNPIRGGEIGCGDVFDAYFIACLMNKKKILDIEGIDGNNTIFYHFALKLANYAAGKKIQSTVRTRVVENNDAFRKAMRKPDGKSKKQRKT